MSQIDANYQAACTALTSFVAKQHASATHTHTHMNTHNTASADTVIAEGIEYNDEHDNTSETIDTPLAEAAAEAAATAQREAEFKRKGGAAVGPFWKRNILSADDTLSKQEV
jgi:hypothetical protein